MKNNDYKRAWLELKGKLLEEYPSLHDLHWPEGKCYSDYDNGRLEKLENVLIKNGPTRWDTRVSKFIK